MLSLLSCHPFKAEWIVPLCPVLRKTAWRAKSCWFSPFIPAARPAGTPHRGQRTNQISAGIAFKTPWVRCRILESKDDRVGGGRCTQVHGGGQGTVCLVLLPHTDQLWACLITPSLLCEDGLNASFRVPALPAPRKTCRQRWDILTPKDRLSLAPNTHFLKPLNNP